MIIRYFIILVAIISLTSCVEEFQPQLDESNTLLVVDGAITNMEGPYTIKLTISTGLDILESEPVIGASVIIIEENGPSEKLKEIKPGIYQTAEGGLQGEIGQKYKLELEFDGKKYESDYDLLKETSPIASVEAKLEYKATIESPDEIPGLQFYVSTGTSPYGEDYYLWKLEGSYKYHASLMIYYVYDNGSLREFNNDDTLNTCYRTYGIGEIYTANTANLTVPRVTNKPLHFLPAIDNKLKVRYSLLTTQYSLSQEAYNFWHEVEQQSKSGGSLYTTQPYQVRGNLKNINDPDEAVLGYFLVAGVEQKRIFVNKPESIKIVLEDCVPDGMALMFIFDSGPDDWPIYLPGGEGVSLGWVEPECVDCQKLGGVLEKPSFWVD